MDFRRGYGYKGRFAAFNLTTLRVVEGNLGLAPHALVLYRILYIFCEHQHEYKQNGSGFSLYI